jgi:hypothetical protein
VKAPDPLLDVLARTIQIEAAYGPNRGFDAVGATILNRARRKRDLPIEQVCRALPCWKTRADGRTPALDAPRVGRSFEQARRVARSILRDRFVDPTAGATEWIEVEDGQPPDSCRRVRIGGRWYFDPERERRKRR